METWKDIPGYEGCYQVSDEGRVRSLAHHVRLVAHGRETVRLSPGRVLKPGPSGPFGHVTVALGRGNSRLVHQLVLGAFVGPRPTGMEGAHADGNGSNNRLENLRYATRSENNRDRVLQGRTLLSPEEVARVRTEAPELPFGGKARLARELGVSPCTISDVIAGRRYAHV